MPGWGWAILLVIAALMKLILGVRSMPCCTWKEGCAEQGFRLPGSVADFQDDGE